MSGLAASSITETNGTKGSLSGSGSSYSNPVTPSGQGAVTCQVGANAAQDGAGNSSTASNTASVTYDTVAPTVAVTPSGTSTGSSPITFTLTFSESVNNLTISGITVTNGSKGSLSGSGANYTIPVTPTGAGAVTCLVNAGAAQDAAGNNNTASNTATVTYLTPQEAWRQTYFGITTNTGSAADTADPDGDGQNNLSEFVAGTVPTDAASHFNVRVAAVSGQPTQMRVIFSPRLTDRTYVVTYKTVLTAATWTPLSSFTVSDNGQERTVTDLLATGGKKYYHVEITKP